MSDGYWFKPKALGYGATPVTWQGWLATAAMVGLAGLIGKYASEGHPDFFALLVPLVLGFVLLAKAKTDGDWKWRP
jgi:hypothetical protein